MKPMTLIHRGPCGTVCVDCLCVRVYFYTIKADSSYNTNCSSNTGKINFNTQPSGADESTQNNSR